MVAITVSGKIGAGKSTLAKGLAKSLAMEYFSIGKYFRELAEKAGQTVDEFVKASKKDIHLDIDNHMKEIAKTKNIIIDARLSGWMVPDADLKIFLTAPLENRVERIKNDLENRTAEKKDENESWTDRIKKREQIEAEKYKKIYGINLTDLNVYDLVINTERIDAADLLEIVELVIKNTVKI